MFSNLIVIDDEPSSKEDIEHDTNIVCYSPNTQAWKVKPLNEKERTQFELNSQGPFRSPGKWNISSVCKENNDKVQLPNDKVQLANVTRTLVLNEKSKMVNNGEYNFYNLVIFIFKKKQ